MHGAGTGPPGLAVVTGASTGIGRAFARLLAREGYDLLLAADEPEVQQVAAELATTGRSVRALEVDLATRHGVEELVSSIAGAGPGPGHATYAASKAFVHSFAEATRHELADTGVTVTSLLPGPTDTDFFARAGMEDTRVARGRKDRPEDVARDGWKALLAGKDHVVAGSVRNRVQAAGAAVVPDPIAAKVAARQTEEVTGS